jgi:hypothetical protein
MNDSDYTQDHGLTTEQIASAGSSQGQEDAPVLAGGEGYEDDNAGYDNANAGYKDNAGYDNANAGYDNGNAGYKDNAGYDDDNAGYDDNAPGLVADQAASGNADHRAPNGDGGSVAAEPGSRAMLLEDGELQGITMRWKDIQAEFVDEPATAVKEADALVAELMQRLAAMFAAERAELETRWSGGNEVSTEDLRQGLRRYRSFFERLLAA